MTVKVRGAKEVLRELRKIDPEARKTFNKEAKRITKPAVDVAQAKYPWKILSGMARPWNSKSGRVLFPYSQSAAQKGVKPSVNTSRRKNYVLAIIQKDVAASIVDMAGKKSPAGSGPGSSSSQRFIKNVTGEMGKPSRVMWPAVESQMPRIEDEMRKVLDEAAKAVNRRIDLVG
jgi:hypothetical protein